MAVIKCFSCCIYDPHGSALYCAACFRSRHPPHRAAHIHVDIGEDPSKDESIEHTLKVAHRVAEMNRYEREGGEMLRRLQQERLRLQQVADDEAVDAGILRYGRTAVALEARLLTLQSELRRQIDGEAEGRTGLAAEQQAAALRIQTALRAYTARRLVSLRLLDRLLRVWSPSLGRDFFFDTVSRTSTWLPPKVGRVGRFLD